MAKDFGELALVLGDAHVPGRAPKIPAKLKRMLVCAFRESKSTISIIGEGLTDVYALIETTFGFGMDQDECSTANDHFNVILMDKNVQKK